MLNRGSRFFVILLRYFLFLILSICVIGLILYNRVEQLSETWYKPSTQYAKNNINLLRKGIFILDDYHDITGGNYYILNKSLDIVYSSNESFDLRFNQLDLKYIPEIDHEQTIEIDSFYRKTELFTLINRYYSDGNETQKYFYLLDKNNKIIETNDTNASLTMSQTELDYLKAYDQQESRYQFDFTYDGYTYYFIAENANYEVSYALYNQQIELIIIAFILTVFFLIILTIVLITKAIKKPLFKLREAMYSYGNDEPIKINDYSGPLEFEEMFDAFELMVSYLEKDKYLKKIHAKEKNQIIANISHDLKTPITVIQGYSKAIIDHRVPENQVMEKIFTISNRANYLNELIQQFHDYAKLDYQGIENKFQSLDIVEVAREYLIERYEELNSHGFSLTIDLPNEKIFRKIDKTLVRRLFANIIDNSLKHNPLGCELIFKIDLQFSTKIIIGDNGQGIAKKDAKYIFDPFTIGDESRSKGGTGLGLSICQRICILHGFNISLDQNSSCCKTCFVIRL